MKMRTVRKATFVGGIATGALLLAGSAAQAADTDVEESTPEMLAGLPVPTDAVPGLGAVQNLPVPGLAAPEVDQRGGDNARTGNDGADQDQSAGNPVGDLLGDLGGGLPVPLPF